MNRISVDEQRYSDDSLGFLKYSGDDLREGVIDARSAGNALLGLDEAIRYFNRKQSPQLRDLTYDLPIQTKIGSWEIVLYGAIGMGGGSFFYNYAKKAGEKMAENDFKDASFTHALQKSLKALQALVRLIQHTGRKSGWTPHRIEPSLSSDMAVVRNEQRDEIRVPLEFFSWYQNLPPDMLARVVNALRPGRRLEIGTRDGNGFDVISIADSEKHLFDPADSSEMDNEFLFPELADGSLVELEGRLIRGSQATNSVGLEYMGHVLNCVPAAGGIKQYKPALFLQCLVVGRVTRHIKRGFVADKRPTIILDRVIPLEHESQTLF